MAMWAQVVDKAKDEIAILLSNTDDTPNVAPAQLSHLCNILDTSTFNTVAKDRAASRVCGYFGCCEKLTGTGAEDDEEAMKVFCMPHCRENHRRVLLRIRRYPPDSPEVVTSMGALFPRLNVGKMRGMLEESDAAVKAVTEKEAKASETVGEDTSAAEGRDAHVDAAALGSEEGKQKAKPVNVPLDQFVPQLGGGTVTRGGIGLSKLQRVNIQPRTMSFSAEALSVAWAVTMPGWSAVHPKWSGYLRVKAVSAHDLDDAPSPEGAPVCAVPKPERIPKTRSAIEESKAVEAVPWMSEAIKAHRGSTAKLEENPELDLGLEQQRRSQLQASLFDELRRFSLLCRFEKIPQLREFLVEYLQAAYFPLPLTELSGEARVLLLMAVSCVLARYEGSIAEEVRENAASYKEILKKIQVSDAAFSLLIGSLM